MGQEDLLKKQIDKLAIALANLLSPLKGLDSPEKAEGTIAYVNSQLWAETGFDLNSLADMPLENFISTLTTNYMLNSTHLSILADVIFNSAKAVPPKDGDKAKQLLKKASILYQHLAANEKNYSFEWHNKIAVINKIL